MTETADSNVSLGEAVGFARLLGYMSRLSQWVVGFKGRPGVAPSADFCCHVFYNQALNTFYNFGIRAFHYMSDALRQDVPRADVKSDAYIATCSANSLVTTSHIWITDPPYADAIHYHEITEYFIAWLAKIPPCNDWIWDSRREFAIRGESHAFRRAMVEAYAAMAMHMPDMDIRW
jgi:putative DNA methylase